MVEHNQYVASALTRLLRNLQAVTNWNSMLGSEQLQTTTAGQITQGRSSSVCFLVYTLRNVPLWLNEAMSTAMHKVQLQHVY
jgi:hypothetical protein